MHSLFACTGYTLSIKMKNKANLPLYSIADCEILQIVAFERYAFYLNIDFNHA